MPCDPDPVVPVEVGVVSDGAELGVEGLPEVSLLEGVPFGDNGPGSGVKSKGS